MHMISIYMILGDVVTTVEVNECTGRLGIKMRLGTFGLRRWHHGRLEELKAWLIFFELDFQFGILTFVNWFLYLVILFFN